MGRQRGDSRGAISSVNNPVSSVAISFNTPRLIFYLIGGLLSMPAAAQNETLAQLTSRLAPDPGLPSTITILDRDDHQPRFDPAPRPAQMEMRPCSDQFPS